MSILVHTQIKELVETVGIISDFEESGLQGASYDMRLGEQYAKAGKIKKLVPDDPSLTIEPGEFALVSTLECLNMPKDLVGHNGIMSSWAKRGLTSLFSPQIDPGFKGILIVPVFNAGDLKISLTYGDPIFTVEFAKTDVPAEYGWSEKNGAQKTLNSRIAVPTRMPDAIESKFQAINVQIVIIWAVLLAVLALVASIAFK